LRVWSPDRIYNEWYLARPLAPRLPVSPTWKPDPNLTPNPGPGPLADADDAEMEDAEGQLQELAAPHADGVAAGIIAAAQQAAADLAELPALVRGGGLPREGHALPCLLHPEVRALHHADGYGFRSEFIAAA